MVDVMNTRYYGLVPLALQEYRMKRRAALTALMLYRRLDKNDADAIAYWREHLASLRRRMRRLGYL